MGPPTLLGSPRRSPQLELGPWTPKSALELVLGQKHAGGETEITGLGPGLLCAGRRALCSLYGPNDDLQGASLCAA